MGTKERKSIQYYMRALHRDIGFLAIGMTLIYALSGIVLIFRGTDFLKSEREVELQLQANIPEQELGLALHSRDFKVIKTENDVIYFQNGTYNSTTGVVKYTNKGWPPFIEKINNIHKASNRSVIHYFTALYAVCLFFLAISSFWMFKPKAKMFKRGLILAGVGILLSVLLLYL